MILNNNYYTYNQSETYISEIVNGSDLDIVKNKRGVEFVNLPCAFDIETTSFTDSGEKRACCYLWQFGFNGFVIIGRNLLAEFPHFISALSTTLNLSVKRRLLCYVHNLAYEFQWIRKYFTWCTGEFDFRANDARKPFAALTDIGVEFRCSFILSGYSLKKVAENLQSYKISKLTEQMDYTLIRHSETTLDDKTIEYAVNDVLIVMAYIDEEIDNAGGNIFNIPLTNTSRVRRYCRNNSKEYQKFVRNNLLLTTDSYIAAKKAFQGGFTHSNSKYTGKTLKNVGSYDFTSSYPFVMVSEKFPMSEPRLLRIKTIEQFNNALHLKCCIFQITLYDVQSTGNDNFISISRCENVRNCIADNGRVYSAAELTTTITELDYKIICANYSFSDMRIGYFYHCKKDYLPLQFVNAILALYSDKTTLKGIEGKDAEYLRKKGMLNSCYGMAVTDIIRNEIGYDNDADTWLESEPNIAEKIEKYNNEYSRFLFYLWGIYVTAYARYNLITNINKLGTDYVYSDTDSIKFLNVKKNQPIFDAYNQSVLVKLKRVSAERKISFDLFQPKTIKGVPKLLGVFDFEGVYDLFKTLGAKRYLCYKNGKLEITVAGVNKKTGIRALLPAEFQALTVAELSKMKISQSVANDAFNLFDFGLTFDSNACGKLTHTYLDEEFSGSVVDCNGVAGDYHELSAIHLEPTTYQMTVTEDYLNFITYSAGYDVEEN